MTLVWLLLLLAAAMCAGVTCQPALVSNIACQAMAQAEAMAAGDACTVALAAAYAAGSCQCAFLARPDADITCCTDETWAPAAAELADACQCTFTAHQAIPANTFDLYACADTQ